MFPPLQTESQLNALHGIS